MKDFIPVKDKQNLSPTFHVCLSVQFEE
jgi:hypothetical protein